MAPARAALTATVVYSIVKLPPVASTTAPGQVARRSQPAVRRMVTTVLGSVFIEE
jgi:hypothetical protein